MGFTLADLGSGGLSGSGSFTTQAIRAALSGGGEQGGGGLPPSRLAGPPEPAGLCRFWIGGGHHQLEGEGSVEILGAGGEWGGGGPEEGVKTLALSTHAGLSGSVNGGEKRQSMTHTNDRNLPKGLETKTSVCLCPFELPGVGTRAGSCHSA